MCMEDVRLGRETIAGESIVSVTTSTVRLCGPSPLRTALIIGSPASGFITLSFTYPVVSGRGMIINALAKPFQLDLQTDGAMVKKEIYAIHSVGTVTIAVWETALEKE